MEKIWLVMRYEIQKVFHSPGFVIVGFCIPVVAVGVLVGLGFIQQSSGLFQEMQGSGISNQFPFRIEGYVDDSGLIQTVPYDIPQGYLKRFESEDLAQQGLRSGDISAYYVIPPDVIERGEVDYVYPDSRSYLEDGQSWVMAWTILVNLMEGNVALANRIWNPIDDFVVRDLTPSRAGVISSDHCSRPDILCEENDLVRIIPVIMAVIFFFIFLSSSSRLFDSVGVEKDNRMIEVLLLSVSPRQLLSGKVLGLGIASLLQTLIWLGSIYLALNLDGSPLVLPPNFVFPFQIILGCLVFFLGGYGLYASMMTAAGALIPKMKEAGAANYIVIFPLFIGYAFCVLSMLTQKPDSILLVLGSIFPLTSPLMMITRLTNSSVPFWQVGLSVVLLYLTAYLTMRAAAVMFRAQNLLSGQPFTLKRYLAIMIQRPASG